MKTQRFGIEIEMTGITRRNAAQVIATYFNTEFSSRNQFSPYYTREITDPQGRIWKVMRDSSIYAEPRNDEYKVELVSPILVYDDLEALQDIVRLLKANGAKANSTCGIHIHIDASTHTVQSLKNLINIMARQDDILYEALQINPNRYNYCKKTEWDFINKVNAQFKKNAKNAPLGEMKKLWYGNQPEHLMNQHYNDTRYHGLNLHATFTKGTVEFRLFNSTLHAGKVKAYIQYCLAVSAKSKNVKYIIPERVKTDDKKKWFYGWLDRLGLTGEEFKTCRKHMTANLKHE